MTSDGSHRICLAVQYDGGAFHGWQLQRRERSVQGEMEQVLTRLFAAPARVLGSGRTDRGVHATGQVAAVDAPAHWSASELRRALNALLPREIWISGAWPVAPRFHPRFDALSRSYVYRVGLAEQSVSPFHARWCWPLRRELDVGLMQNASSLIVGDHSFRAFAKAGQEERGDRCIVAGAEWQPWEPLGIEFHITANRFLHHMVRYLVGTLVAVGMGRRPLEDIERLLAGMPGLLTSPPAPPEGLFLTRVGYPPPPYGPVMEVGGENAADLPTQL
jgi:tRNA pseudouridine38-40 synthase